MSDNIMCILSAQFKFNNVYNINFEKECHPTINQKYFDSFLMFE